MAPYLNPATGAGAEARVDDLFDQAARLRDWITDLARKHAHQLKTEDLILLQSQLHGSVDQLLASAAEKLFEDRLKILTDQAQRDSLTGLYNRSALDRRLSGEVERARRYSRRISLVLLDIDHFKSINDRFGHLVGDEVLTRFARILESSLRKTDAAYRFGGDEFVAICPETSADAMVNVLRRLETNFSAYCRQKPFSRHVGISWGVSSYPEDATEADDLVRISDQRLYECKINHRIQTASQS